MWNIVLAFPSKNISQQECLLWSDGLRSTNIPMSLVLEVSLAQSQIVRQEL